MRVNTLNLQRKLRKEKKEAPSKGQKKGNVHRLGKRGRHESE
ncbi:hypothetical protein CAEBREN_22964 [Caenorhabditis brenneri]|uniref:Uncharacterized protein n=1 Tax=Caenorhabditis brenneri TaxID=135651 RepID=G0NV32_CAEBE|nr:hypothetical protein CAEBREN_22964 [Caenorhabditis brenneri]